MDEDFLDGFEVIVSRKPVGGVVEKDIPKVLADKLATEVPKVLASADHELSIKGKTDVAARKIALYARAWGARQEPKLRITKIPNRRDMPDNVARLSVAKEDDVPVENRPGRRPTTAK